MMFEEEDDIRNLVVKEQPAKHAARSTENDRAMLLSDGEEYTDIFADGAQTGRFVDSSNLDEGQSTSASDNEVMGYTGDAESYVDDDDDNDNYDYGKSENSFMPSVIEGTLINVDEEKGLMVDDTSQDIPKVDNFTSKTLINNSISDIASKLEETSVTSTSLLSAKPGLPVKIEGTEIFLNEFGLNSESDLTSAKESEGQVLRDNNFGHTNNLLDESDITQNQRKKRLKKRTKSYTENDDLTSSIEVLPELDKSPFKDINGHFEEYKKYKRKSFSKKSQDKSREKETKLIDIETPPQTPAMPSLSAKNQVKETQLTGKRTQSSSSSKNKRRRSRYKIYLDDPDVHDLINDHVFLLQKYQEDLLSGRTHENKGGKNCFLC